MRRHVPCRDEIAHSPHHFTTVRVREHGCSTCNVALQPRNDLFTDAITNINRTNRVNLQASHMSLDHDDRTEHIPREIEPFQSEAFRAEGDKRFLPTRQTAVALPARQLETLIGCMSSGNNNGAGGGDAPATTTVGTPSNEIGVSLRGKNTYAPELVRASEQWVTIREQTNSLLVPNISQ